jgi:hypothetical protein
VELKEVTLSDIKETEAVRLRERVKIAEQTKDEHVILIMELDLAAQLGRVSYLKSFIGND